MREAGRDVAVRSGGVGRVAGRSDGMSVSFQQVRCVCVCVCVSVFVCVSAVMRKLESLRNFRLMLARSPVKFIC